MIAKRMSGEKGSLVSGMTSRRHYLARDPSRTAVEVASRMRVLRIEVFESQEIVEKMIIEESVESSSGVSRSLAATLRFQTGR
jgi:hypothetical protein